VLPSHAARSVWVIADQFTGHRGDRDGGPLAVADEVVIPTIEALFGLPGVPDDT